jgi:hypothetical protein
VVAKREHGCAKVEGMNELSGVIFLNFLELYIAAKETAIVSNGMVTGLSMRAQSV